MRRVHPRLPYESKAQRVDPVPSRRIGSRSRARLVAFAVIVGVAFVLAGALLLRENNQPVEPNATRVTVSMSGFTPNALTVKTGEPLRIDLINLDNQYHTDGGGRHNFVFETLGVSVLVQPLGQAVFTVPTSSQGTYQWYCDVCCGGRDNPAMVGTLTVVP